MAADDWVAGHDNSGDDMSSTRIPGTRTAPGHGLGAGMRSGAGGRCRNRSDVSSLHSNSHCPPPDVRLVSRDTDNTLQIYVCGTQAGITVALKREASNDETRKMRGKKSLSPIFFPFLLLPAADDLREGHLT